MDKKPTQIISEFYTGNIKNSFTDHGILGWENRKNHIERFKVFTEYIPFENKSILDVGCGLGNLYGYLQECLIEPSKYTGVDILECMVQMASERNKDQEFICADIFKDFTFAHANKGKYDIIVSSGIFNLNIGNNEKFLGRAMEIYRELQPQYIAFNFLDADFIEEDKRFWLVKTDVVENIIMREIPSYKAMTMIKGRPAGDAAVIVEL